MQTGDYAAANGEVIEVHSDAEYRAIVEGSPDKLVVIDFSATWCGPCRAIAPLYHDLPKEYPGIIFLKVDVDECDEAAAHEGIAAMPTFLFKRNGDTVEMVRGANPANLRAALERNAAPVAAQPTAGVIAVCDDEEYEAQIDAAAGRLVVVDFSAKWCGPCRGIAPFFEQLAQQHPDALFLKVDVDECPATAIKEGVRAMPTFLFFRDGIRCDDLQGADSEQLKHKVAQFSALQPGQVAAKYQEYQMQQQQQAVSQTTVSPLSQ